MHNDSDLQDFMDPSGVLVKYDPNMYEIKYDAIPESDEKKPYLHFKDSFRGKVVIPDGLTDATKMFEHCILCSHPNHDFSEFDTSKVENMKDMFSFVMFPGSFSLGDKFDTSNVKNMYRMFFGTKFPEGFSLGDKFDTSKVENMDKMFFDTKFFEGFSLGDKFDTSKVKNMKDMFSFAEFLEGFSLGDKFDTSNVEDMSGMFYKTELPEGFLFGDKFDMSNVTNMNKMFYGTEFPKGFLFGDKFNFDKYDDRDFEKLGFGSRDEFNKMFDIPKKSNTMYDKLQRACAKSDAEYQEIDDFKDIKKPGE